MAPTVKRSEAASDPSESVQGSSKPIHTYNLRARSIPVGKQTDVQRQQLGARGKRLKAEGAGLSSVRVDPVDTVGALCTTLIFKHLDPVSLANCSLVCKQWREYANDDAMWDGFCKELWEGKVYIPSHIKQLQLKKEAYFTSLKDSTRVAITEDELCSFAWQLRFKATAGLFWLIMTQGRPVTRFFLRDHTMSAPPRDPVWDPNPAAEKHTWQFRKSKEGRRGLFVQVNRYPSLEITRTPTWGWKMENVWVDFHSHAADVTAPVQLPDEEPLQILDDDED